MATGRPTRFKWQHRGRITHSTLLHIRSKLVVFGEYWFLFATNGQQWTHYATLNSQIIIVGSLR